MKRDVGLAVLQAAEDYDWTQIYGEPGFAIFAKKNAMVSVSFTKEGAIEVVIKYALPNDVDVADTYLHGKIEGGRMVNTQYHLVPALRIFEGSL